MAEEKQAMSLCKHTETAIYGMHLTSCDEWLPDGACTCGRVVRRCCECGARIKERQ